MKRPRPIFKIHDSTPIFSRAPDQTTWAAFPITRKTARSVFVDTPNGELQLDRIALERSGQVKRRGQLFCLVHPNLPALDQRSAA